MPLRTEFRTSSADIPEPRDRATEGVVLGEGDSLDLGILDTTDEPQTTPVRVLWWRVADLGEYRGVTNIRVWLEGPSTLEGANAWFMDITDAWRRSPAAVSVETGNPGEAPLTRPSAPNLARHDGGPITGITHDQTSGYIYLAARIGVDQPTGTPDLALRISYDCY